MDKRIHEMFNQEILEKAAKLFGVNDEDVKKVGGFENYIFEYQKNNIDYIMRISHTLHRSIQQVESELDFVNFLANNHANVSIPILSINKRLVEIIASDEGFFIVTSYHKAKGSHVRKDTATDLFFENYGKTVGQFHRLTKYYQLLEGLEKRYEWNEDSLILDAEKYLPKADQVILEKLQLLLDYLNQLPKNKDNYGLIHTDVHMGNFYVFDNQLTVFDFDDCAYQWYVSDIAIALFYYVAFIDNEEVKIAKAKDFMKLFMKGYHRENKLDLDAFKQFPYFLKLREFILYIVIHRSCNLETDEWGKRFISLYRDRIINDIPFVQIDFTEYYTK